MSVSAVRSELRRARKRSRLPVGAVCTYCGERRPDALLDAHHVVGRALDPDLVVVLCRNCHAVETAGQLDRRLFERIRQADTVLDRAALWARELATFHRREADSLERHASGLERLIAGLDRAYPAWRQLPEAIGEPGVGGEFPHRATRLGERSA